MCSVIKFITYNALVNIVTRLSNSLSRKIVDQIKMKTFYKSCDFRFVCANIFGSDFSDKMIFYFLPFHFLINNFILVTIGSKTKISTLKLISDNLKHSQKGYRSEFINFV